MKEFFEAIQAGRRDDAIGMLDREPGLLKALDGNGLGIALTVRNTLPGHDRREWSHRAVFPHPAEGAKRMKEFFEVIQAGRRDDVIGMLDREPGLLKALDGNGLGIALTHSQYLTGP